MEDRLCNNIRWSHLKNQEGKINDPDLKLFSLPQGMGKYTTRMERRREKVNTQLYLLSPPLCVACVGGERWKSPVRTHENKKKKKVHLLIGRPCWVATVTYFFSF
jgi:hypothetical protein